MVQGMFKRYAAGEHSYTDLVDWLNEAGCRTRAGRRFSKATVGKLLRNPFYKGSVVYKQGQQSQDVGEIYNGQHEAIVSEEVWENVQKMREQMR